jgi:L-threonylcarbamoyladenylate synthase
MNGMRIAPPTPEAIAQAARTLAGGELVAFPTETVYGLGANADDPQAVGRIYAAKRRPIGHPLIVHLPDAGALDAWARDVPADARALASAFWPGPLTLILPRAPGVGDAVTGGQNAVGLRVPAHPVARALLQAFADLGGRGVAAPSANRFGHVSPTTAQHVADDLGDEVRLILDGGECEVGIESTIVAFTGGVPVLLRPGGLALADIARVLGRVPRSGGDDAPRAPGTLASHYAPRTPALRVDAHAMRAEVAQLGGRDERVAVLARTVSAPAGFDGVWHAAPHEAAAYAHGLYAALRSLDASGADVMLIEDVPDEPAWLAVRDRLARATHGVDDDRD